MGISRYYSSTNTPPNKFYSISNMYSPVRGELTTIPGLDILTNAIPACSTIEDIMYLGQTNGDEGFLVHYTATSSSYVAPPTSQFTFTSPTAFPGGTRDILIEFVYPGGSTLTSVAVAQSTGSTTLTGQKYLEITLPTSSSAIPSSCYSINYYVLDNTSTILSWAGCHMRKDGIFPEVGDNEAIIRIPTPTTAAGTNVAIGAVPPTSMTATSSSIAGGTLEPGRVYFFGIAPYITQLPSDFRLNAVSLYPSATSISGGRFSAYVNSGHNALTITFAGIPTSTGTSVTNVNYYQVFMGKTPEDMAPVSTITGSASGARWTSGPYYVGTAGATSLSMVVLEAPYNTNQAMSMGNYDTTPVPLNVAKSDRIYGTWCYQTAVATRRFGVNKTNSKALAYVKFPYSSQYHREQLPGYQFGYTTDQAPTTLTSNLANTSTSNANNFGYGFSLNGGVDLNSTTYQDLAIFVNGYSGPYKSNGDLCAPFYGSGTKRTIPITTNVSLYKDRLIWGCGKINWSYDKGLVFYSDAGDPYSTGTGVGNFLNVNFGDTSDMIGFGVFSKDLSTVGPTTFLAIGKVNSTYTWNGGTTAADQSLVQVGKAIGWMSSKSFGLTKNGAVVVTPQGLFTLDGSDMKELDPGTSPIFAEIAPADRQYVVVAYTEDRFIVGYRLSGLGTFGIQPPLVSTEIWYDFRDEPDGTVTIVPTGPHTLLGYTSMISVPVYKQSYGALVANYRLSWGGQISSRLGEISWAPYIVRRDVPWGEMGTLQNYDQNTGTLTSIPISLQLNDTGLGAEEFIKIITRMYLKAKIYQEQTITITIEARDVTSIGDGNDYSGTAASTSQETLTMSYTGAFPGDIEIYRTFQKLFTTRYRGTIFTISLSTTTNQIFTIVSTNVLFKPEKRRLL